MTGNEIVKRVCASVAADILSIVLAAPGGLSPGGMVHVHEITPGFPILEQLQSRRERVGEASVQCVWHDSDNPLMPSDQYLDPRVPKIDFHIGMALLPWSNPEEIFQAGKRISGLGWSNCMDRVIAIASTAEVIRGLDAYLGVDAEMMNSAPLALSIIQVDSFRFVAAVFDPQPLGH